MSLSLAHVLAVRDADDCVFLVCRRSDQGNGERDQRLTFIEGDFCRALIRDFVGVDHRWKFEITKDVFVLAEIQLQSVEWSQLYKTVVAKFQVPESLLQGLRVLDDVAFHLLQLLSDDFVFNSQPTASASVTVVLVKTVATLCI